MLSQKKKVCSKCEKELTIDNFHKRRTGKFGVRSACKDCRKKKNNHVNTDVSIKQTCSDCGKEFPATVKHFHRSKTGKFGVRNGCKECTNKKVKQWQKDNTELLANKRRVYQNKRYHNDEQYRIQKLLSRGLRRALNNIGQSKNASTLQYIGCDIAFLQQHLNNTKDDNWGDVELDIDHIIPQSLYDHTNKEEIKKCWNWRNLRYFPKSDNISKGNILDMALVEKYGISDLLPDFLRGRYVRFSKIKSRIITKIT